MTAFRLHDQRQWLWGALLVSGLLALGAWLMLHTTTQPATPPLNLVAPFDYGDTARITITQSDKSVVVEKHDDLFWHVVPAAGASVYERSLEPVDPQVVHAVRQMVHDATIIAETGSAEQADAYGLSDTERIHIHIESRARVTEPMLTVADVWIGSAGPLSDTVFAQQSPDGPVYTVHGNRSAVSPDVFSAWPPQGQ